MISSIEWIPQGVADPNPKKYELSRAERELLEEQARIQRRTDLGEDGDDSDAVDDHMDKDDDDDDDDDEEEEEDENDDAMETIVDGETLKDPSSMTATELIASQRVDTSTLPADLRMDEYSSDEDNDGNDPARVPGSNIGNLLIGNDGNGGIGIDPNGNLDALPSSSPSNSHSSTHSLDSEDSDDDLSSIPDTREYAPTDIPGLQSMAFSGHTTNGNQSDDDASVDSENRHDTNLLPTDALPLPPRTDAEAEFSALEVLVYERPTGNLFVHHDIPLPSYPLSVAHGTA